MVFSKAGKFLGYLFFKDGTCYSLALLSIWYWLKLKCAVLVMCPMKISVICIFSCIKQCYKQSVQQYTLFDISSIFARFTDMICIFSAILMILRFCFYFSIFHPRKSNEMTSINLIQTPIYGLSNMKRTSFVKTFMVQ